VKQFQQHAVILLTARQLPLRDVQATQLDAR